MHHCISNDRRKKTGTKAGSISPALNYVREWPNLQNDSG